MKMKHFNDDNVGNDCNIYEDWYFVTKPFKCAIHLVRASGWGDHGPEVSTFTAPNDDMPKQVQQWFKNETTS